MTRVVDTQLFIGGVADGQRWRVHEWIATGLRVGIDHDPRAGGVLVRATADHALVVGYAAEDLHVGDIAELDHGNRIKVAIPKAEQGMTAVEAVARALAISGPPGGGEAENWPDYTGDATAAVQALQDLAISRRCQYMSAADFFCLIAGETL